MKTLLYAVAAVALLVQWACPTQHGILVQWQASPSPSVTYAVSRSQTHGGPYQAIASNLTTLSYDDATTVSGQTYYYVVQSFCPTCEVQLSLLSNEAVATAK